MWGYLRDLFQTNGFGDTTNFEHITQGYYVSQYKITMFVNKIMSLHRETVKEKRLSLLVQTLTSMPHTTGNEQPVLITTL